MFNAIVAIYQLHPCRLHKQQIIKGKCVMCLKGRYIMTDASAWKQAINDHL